MSASTSVRLFHIIRALRVLAGDFMGETDGDVKTKYRPQPKKKPPRRKSPVKNKSNRSDYSTKYMREYREKGEDYQKKPENIKRIRREQQKRLQSL